MIRKCSEEGRSTKLHDMNKTYFEQNCKVERERECVCVCTSRSSPSRLTGNGRIEASAKLGAWMNFLDRNCAKVSTLSLNFTAQIQELQDKASAMMIPEIFKMSNQSEVRGSSTFPRQTALVSSPCGILSSEHRQRKGTRNFHGISGNVFFFF